MDSALHQFLLPQVVSSLWKALPSTQQVTTARPSKFQYVAAHPSASRSLFDPTCDRSHKCAADPLSKYKKGYCLYNTLVEIIYQALPFAFSCRMSCIYVLPGLLITTNSEIFPNFYDNQESESDCKYHPHSSVDRVTRPKACLKAGT